MQRKLAMCGFVSVVGLSLIAMGMPVQAVPLDKDGDIRLGVRTYVNARVGTENTDRYGVGTGDRESQTFPYSPSGHLRQNRFFIEAELDHDLSRLAKEGVGPLELLHHLPFKVRGLKYHLTFRGEGEGLYDWGPSEYSTSAEYTTPEDPGNDPVPHLNPNPVSHLPVDVSGTRHKTRKLGTDRERLFQAYIEGSVGDLFFRLGRQIWAWGETDGFRLLDQINPVDSSFGGFMVSLDERRVPLDMLRLEYRLGEFGPLTEVALHAYAAIDNKVGFYPGTPNGSPWALPNLGAPGATTRMYVMRPTRTISDMRGGGRLYWNMLDATFSLAHYYTYFDNPTLASQVVCIDKDCSPVLGTFPLGFFPDGFSAHAIQSAPKVQVTGATTTFPIPVEFARLIGLGGEPILRSEFAYFRDEPRWRQSKIDPFIYRYDANLRQVAGEIEFPNDEVGSGKRIVVTGGRNTGESVNYVIGFDVNQYVRFLNPYQTFFFSTQFFYKHLLHAHKRGTPFSPSARANKIIVDGEVLPVPKENVTAAGFRVVEPNFVMQPTDQFLHTLFIGTSYRSGTVSPGFTFFYDWGGAFVYQPTITFSRDPWRFTTNVTILEASGLKGASGVGLLRDRDNVMFQVEYSI